MGLMIKEIEIVLNSKNIKHYEDLGYEIPKYYNKHNSKFLVKHGTKIIVKVEHLTNGSTALVNVKCDGENCDNPYLKPITWQSYLKCVKDNGKYYCLKCAMNLYGIINSNKTKLKNGISFEQWCIQNNKQDILNRFNYELNDCLPNEICSNSANKYYFKCPKGLHESELKQINNFINGKKGVMYCKQCNSFAQYLIDNFGKDALNKYWDWNKNTINPWYISRGNGTKKVWIKCQDKYDYHGSNYVSPNSFIASIGCCPECQQERKESFLQEKVRLYLELFNYTILHENKCTILPINPKTKYPLPFDNEVKELSLIIEIHGKQHYELCGWHKLLSKSNNTTPEQELHKRKLYDRYKRIFAKSQGYFYLEIPFWTDDKNETWKKLIDDKIKEVII